jgi:hypothetical protein
MWHSYVARQLLPLPVTAAPNPPKSGDIWNRLSNGGSESQTQGTDIAKIADLNLNLNGVYILRGFNRAEGNFE